MDKVLILGACGTAGDKILTRLKEVYPTVAMCNRHDSAWGRLDLTDGRAVDMLLSQYHPDVIVYAAGLTDVDRCERDKGLADTLNHRVPRKLAESTATRIIYLSTDYVFDGTRGNYSEADVPHPTNHYGSTKLSGEHAVLDADDHNLVVRVSGLYGLHSRGTNGWLNNLIGSSAEADSDRFSSPTFTDDLAGAIDHLLRLRVSGIVHVVGPDRMSRYEFAKKVIRALGLPCVLSRTKHVPDRFAAKRPLDTSLSCARVGSLGFSISTVDEGLYKIKAQMDSKPLLSQGKKEPSKTDEVRG